MNSDTLVESGILLVSTMSTHDKTMTSIWIGLLLMLNEILLPSTLGLRTSNLASQNIFQFPAETEGVDAGRTPRLGSTCRTTGTYFRLWRAKDLHLNLFHQVQVQHDTDYRR